MRLNERLVIRIVLLLLVGLAAAQLYVSNAHAAVQGFLRMGYPRAPAKRAKAEARVLEVYAAIDAATDDPELRQELRRRCKSESWCNWYRVKGIHDDDASLGRRRWNRAARRGLIHPDECPEHQLGETREDWHWWSTVGAFGTVSAYVIRHAGKCVHPRAMVDPKVAARLAVAHAGVLCRRHGACSCEGRARWWAGPGRWAKRSHLHRLRSVTFYCGPVPSHRWVLAAVMDAWGAIADWTAALLEVDDDAATDA